ncbi:DUF6412 domain-containing protein [Rhodococcus maanshanensis]|uniref:DUF6412 domain-containing protein n=1 Tax=Rhodococcus maanshanensis TaxID=183556 RepID=UPI000B2DEC8A|nr:DUF6412 domain-containing protein [Rhodococcus maanshanensis]
MAWMWSLLARRLNLVQLTWVAMLTLVIATATAMDGPTAVVGAAIAIVLLLAVAGQGSLSQLRSLTEPTTGPSRDEQRLRGAFRRQSAPDTPGRPRRPRAPGQVLAAALH